MKNQNEISQLAKKAVNLDRLSTKEKEFLENRIYIVLEANAELDKLHQNESCEISKTGCKRCGSVWNNTDWGHHCCFARCPHCKKSSVLTTKEIKCKGYRPGEGCDKNIYDGTCQEYQEKYETEIREKYSIMKKELYRDYIELLSQHSTNI